MKNVKRVYTLIALVITTIILASCAKTAENEHLPEYCQTYSGFMSIASEDIYEEMNDINRYNYLSIIAEIDLSFEAEDPTDEFDLSGIQCFQNLTSLTLTGPGIKDISQISALRNIQSITLIDTNIVSIASFKNLSKVKELNITGSYSLQSVDGVEEMTKLTSLILTDNGIVNISELNSLVNLQTLVLNDNEITHFPNINQLENLITLEVRNNNITTLGEDLSGLSNLETFDAGNNNICDLSSLDDLVSLKKLILNDNNLGCEGTSPDFSSLLNATSLEELNLENNGLTSISDLAGKNLPLKKLFLQDNLLTDITPISSFTSLLELDLSNNLISDINDLSGMINLTVINLNDNLLTEFTDLLLISGLEEIYLHNNEITEIPPIGLEWPNLALIDLHNNLLDDISGVKGHPTLVELDIRNNGLTHIVGLSELPNLEILVVDQDPDELDEEGEPIVEDNPNNIRVIDDSFNNTDLPIIDFEDDAYELILPFELDDNVEIYGSFNGINQLQVIDLHGMEIDLIDEFSFNSDNIYAIYVQDNNLTDISFLLNNPNILQIVISENPITNLGILSGADKSDFDNVTQILATDIPIANDLTDAFIDLPALITLDISGTEFSSINNSFNGLNNLSSLQINATSITEIIDSFNNLDPDTGGYSFTLSEGNIGLIDNSFNDGTFQIITLSNQTSTLPVTSITDSFNNLTINANSGMLIQDSDFNNIDNSFNGSYFVNLGIVESEVEVFTNSLVGTTVNDILSFHGNDITTLDLSSITTVRNLVLSQNGITSVAFIDSIPGLEELNLSNQLGSDGFTLPLTEIDGINNQPDLDTVNLTGLPLTAIDGFKNTLISEFDRPFADNLNTKILSITSDSFSGSPIDMIDLSGHDLTDIAFLDNLTVLDDLTISVDIADLSVFAGNVFEATITSLYIENVQSIPDFSIFSGYDALTFIGFDTPDTIITNLDGLDGVTQVNLANDSSITSFIGSFNSMSTLEPQSNYLNNFSSLDTITTSFDMFGSSSSVQIGFSITITDSFNLVETIQITNDNELVPLFDTLSFDSATSITFIDPNYNDYSFLSGYTTLNSVNLVDVQANVTGLSNNSITSLDIAATSSVSSISADIAAEAQLNVDYSGFSTLTLSSNNEIYNLNIANADLIVNSTNSSLSLSGSANDITLNSTTIVQVNIVNADIVDFVSNTNLLNTFTDTNTQSSMNSLELNTVQANVDLSTRADQVDLYNNSLLTMNTLNVENTIEIHTTSTSLQLIAEVGELVLLNDTLVSLTITGTGSVDSITVDSDVFNNLNITSDENDVDEVEITTLVSDLFFASFNTTLLNVNGVNVNTLFAAAPSADVTLLGNQTVITFEGSVDTLNLNNANLHELYAITGSFVNGTLTTTSTSLNTVDLVDASINTLDFNTNVGTINVTGSNIDDIALDATNATTVTLDTTSSDVVLTTGAASISLTVDAVSLVVDSPTTNVVGINVSNTLNTLDLNSITNLTDLNAIGTISNTIIGTTSSTLNITSTNSISTVVNSNLITSLTADVGVGNNLDFTSTNIGIVTFDVVADTFNSSIAASTAFFSNSSDIESLDMNNSTVENMIFGSADIESLIFENTTTNTLSINGSNIAATTIDGGFSDLVLTLGTSVTEIASTNISPVSVTTDLGSFSYNGAADVEIIDGNLNNLIVNNAGDEVVVTGSSATLAVDGSAGLLQITSSTLSSLTIGNSGSITDIELYEVSISNLVLNNQTTNLMVNSLNITGLDITSGTSLINVDLDISNLNAFSLDKPTAVVGIITSATTLDVDGTMDTLDINGDNLTNIDLNNLVYNGLSTQTNNLGALNTYDIAPLSEVVINSLQPIFTLDTISETVTLNVPTSANVFINSTSDQSLEITTLGDEVTVNSAITDFRITGENIERVNGIFDRFTLIGPTVKNVLTIDVAGNHISILPSFETILMIGTNNIHTVSVSSGNLALIATNDNIVNTLDINGSSDLLTIDSDAASITHSSYDVGTLNLIAYDNTTYVNTDALILNASSTSLGDLNVTLSNEGTTREVNLSNIDIANIIVDGTGVSIVIDGTVNSWTLDGNGLVGVTMNTINISDLSGFSTVLDTLVTLEMENFTVSDLGVLIGELENTGITITSGLTNLEVDNFYYAQKYAELDNVTERNIRFDAIHSPLVDAAYIVFDTNIYLQYLDETASRNEINNQVYQTVQQYFDGYASSLGFIDEADMLADETYTQTDIDDIKAAIQVTLDDAALSIDSIAIDAQVEQSIVDDANDETNNKGFTVVEIS